jgi:hypothetical protein
VKGKVNLGNDNEAEVMGKCTLVIKVNNGSIMYMHDTLFVLSLINKLISIVQLNSKNYKNVFEGKFCKLFNNNGLVAKVSMRDNRIFLLSMESSVACLKASVDESCLWHKMFGHLNFGSISFMQKKNLVRGFPSFIKPKNKICEGCAIGK